MSVYALVCMCVFLNSNPNGKGNNNDVKFLVLLLECCTVGGLPKNNGFYCFMFVGLVEEEESVRRCQRVNKRNKTLRIYGLGLCSVVGN